MEQDLIRERYDLSMARIRDFLTEETVPEVYRDYFKKVSPNISANLAACSASS